MKRISFKKRVLAIVQKIPKGKVLTYKEVARRALSPGASRAVGTIMKGNYDSRIPCHRVVRSDGRIGDYNRGGYAKKMSILRREGVLIKSQKVVF